MDAPVDVDAMRERIRFICAQGQEQWHASWTQVLSEHSSTRCGLVLPDVFLHSLQANGVFFSRPEARALVERFQAPNGAVIATKFIQWVALSAPVDHVNPELRFARLPQPFRRIVKVLEEDILDVAWRVITTTSERYSAQVAGGGGAWTARSASSSAEQPGNAGGALDSDFQAAKKRVVKPARRVAVAPTLKTPHVVALASHPCAPVTVVVESDHDSGQHVLQLVRTSLLEGRKDSDSSGAVVFSLDWWTSDALESTPPSTEGSHCKVLVGSVSSLQPLLRIESDLDAVTSWCLAVRLVKATTITDVSADPASPAPPSTTTSGQISVMLVEIDETTASVTCRRVVVLNDADTDASATVELSQDVRFLSLSSAARGIELHRVPGIGQWRQQAVESEGVGDSADDGMAADDSGSLLTPPFDMTSTPGVALSETVPHSLDNESAANQPRLHFLVAPVTTSSAVEKTSKPFASLPTTYALVACVGTRVLKFLLPGDPSCQSVAYQLQWEHLSRITASTVDASSEILVAACAGGSLVVWNVLRDRDHSFMSTATSASSSPAVIDAVLYRKGVVVALSTTSQRVWFFDASKRSTPTLLRVVTPPPSSSAAATTITALASSTTALGLPVAILHFSTGLAVLYDMRTAQATGSVRTSSPLLSASSFALCGLGQLSSDHNQAEVVDVYVWDQLMPANFSNGSDEEAGSEAAEDPIAFLYRLAGKSKPLPSASSPPKPKPLHQELMRRKNAAANVLPLQPLIPNWDARFQQLCDERLAPQSMAERDAALLRRQRAILKAVAGTAAG